MATDRDWQKASVAGGILGRKGSFANWYLEKLDSAVFAIYLVPPSTSQDIVVAIDVVIGLNSCYVGHSAVQNMTALTLSGIAPPLLAGRPGKYFSRDARIKGVSMAGYVSKWASHANVTFPGYYPSAPEGTHPISILQK